MGLEPTTACLEGIREGILKSSHIASNLIKLTVLAIHSFAVNAKNSQTLSAFGYRLATG